MTASAKRSSDPGMFATRSASLSVASASMCAGRFAAQLEAAVVSAEQLLFDFSVLVCFDGSYQELP